MANENIKAGSAWWRITAQDEVTKTLDKIAERLSSFGKTTMVAGGAIAAAGAAIVAPVLAAAQSWSDYAGNLEDASIRTGFAVESLSTLNLVAAEQGSSAEALSKGLVGAVKFTSALASGSQQAAKALDELGISQSSLMAANPEERFKMLADGISRIQDPAQRAAAAMKVFGKSGNELIPMLALGGDGITKMQEQFAALGLAVPSKDIGMFAAFGDELGTIGKQLKRIWHEFGAALIESVSPFLPIFKSLLAQAIEFAQNNRGLIKIVLAFGAALAVAGTAIVGIGGAMAAVGAIISGVSAAIAALPAIAAALGAVFAFITGPVGIFVAVAAGVALIVGAIITAFVQLTDVGAKTWDSLIAGLQSVWTIFRQTVGGIFDAIIAGQWSLAFEIAWAAVVLVFKANIATLTGLTTQFVEWFVRPILDGLRKVEEGFEYVFGPIGVVAAAQDKLGMFAEETRQAAWADFRAQKAELERLTAAAAKAREKVAAKFDFSRTRPEGADTTNTTAVATQAAKSGAAVLGTFSATVAGMLGGARPEIMEAIAENTQRSAETLDRIEDKMAEGGLEFE